MATPEIVLHTVYPTVEPGKPNYWGNPVPIPGLGSIGLEVTNIAEDKKGKRFKGLEFILRTETASISLGMPRAPFYIVGDMEEITYQNSITPNVPQTLISSRGQKYDANPFSYSGSGAIITGFPSRTLDQVLGGLRTSTIDPQQKEALALFILLKTLQPVRDIHESEHIHGDLDTSNIIVDDSLKEVNLIDMFYPMSNRRVPVSFRNDLTKVIGNFRQIFGYIEKETNEESLIKRKELEIPYNLQTREECLAVLGEFIELAKHRLLLLGYPSETAEQQLDTAFLLRDIHKRVQILYCFNRQKEDDPKVPSPNEEQLTQIIAAMDTLVSNAPDVALPKPFYRSTNS